MPLPEMTASIPSSIIACLKSFNDFIAEIKKPPLSDNSKLGLVPIAWEDELGRLRMWTANTCAHQTSQSSLDFRLRDSSHIREQIVRLLQELLQRLEDTREVLAEGEIAVDGDEVFDDPSGDDYRPTEVQELRESVATIINCLFQMSILVQKPAQHDIILGSRQAEFVMFEPFDYIHVQNKFPRMDDSIALRLGLAITRRRRYLNYRERHALKVKKEINTIIPEQDGGKATAKGSVNLLPVTTATKEPHVRFDDGASNSGDSQTSYAPTLLDGGRLSIPRPPKRAKGESSFECPYCHFIITTSGICSWNRHVMRDLQPYVCIAATCATPDKLYSTRREWLHHMKTVYPIDSSFHKEVGEAAPGSNCPLCKEIFHSELQYNGHVAQHLEELALFALPSVDDDSDADGSGSDIESDAGSDASEESPKTRNLRLLWLLECRNDLSERFGADSVEALKRGVVRYGPLRDGILEIETKLLAMNFGRDRKIEAERMKLLRKVKRRLTAIDLYYSNTS